MSGTARAADKVRALMADEPAGEADVLRVAIQGGGCVGCKNVRCRKRFEVSSLQSVAFI